MSAKPGYQTRKEYRLADETIEKYEIDELIKWLQTNPRLTQDKLVREFEGQYAKWLGLALKGDLGRDQRDLSVSETILQRLPITLELAFLSIMVGILIGIPAGIVAAVKQRKPSDYVATSAALVGLSVWNERRKGEGDIGAIRDLETELSHPGEGPLDDAEDA